MKIVNLVRERQDGMDHDVWVDTFEMEDTVENPEAKLRETVQAFLATDEGKFEIARTCQDFNWGDVVQSIPFEFMLAHGIRKTDANTTDIMVNQDEVLCDYDEIGDEELFVSEYDDENLPF